MKDNTFHFNAYIEFIAGKFDRLEKKNRYEFKKFVSKYTKPKTEKITILDDE